MNAATIKVTITGALGVLGALAVAAMLATAPACNTGMGNCPAKETVQPGGSCNDDKLQCAFDLATPDPSCDGTQTTIATSCSCDKGHWSCPDPIACDAGPTGGDEGGTQDEGGTHGDVGAPRDAGDAG